MKQISKEEILSRTVFFQNISRESLSAIAGICLSKTLGKKEHLFHEDDPGISIYILISGSIQLYKTASDGRENVIKVVKPGEIFAEAVLFEQSKYPVNARALNSSHVYMLPRHQFTCLLENSGFRNDFLGMMMKKVRYLTNQINYLSSHDVEERLFLFLEEQYGRKDIIKVAISKKDIANAIRTTPETLSRLLLRLKDDGKLIWKGNEIIISAGVWKSPEL